MKKILTIALIAVLVVCALLLVACDKEDKKADTTTAASTTAKSTTAKSTTAEPTTAEPTTEAVTTAFPQALKDVMPPTLPDGSQYTVAIRVDLENEADYNLKGNAKDAGNYGFDMDGIYGKGMWVGSAPADKSNLRAEIEVEPVEYAFEIGGCSGILWYVDFTNTTPNLEKEGCCTSITMDTNDYRSNKDGELSVGYYYQDGQWVETKNVNACRMHVPHQFKGWVYVPATSYNDTAAKTPIAGEDGNFPEMTTYTFRTYTDYYDMSAGVDFKIIFDEVMWVKKAA